MYVREKLSRLGIRSPADILGPQSSAGR